MDYDSFLCSLFYVICIAIYERSKIIDPLYRSGNWNFQGEITCIRTHTFYVQAQAERIHNIEKLSSGIYMMNRLNIIIDGAVP